MRAVVRRGKRVVLDERVKDPSPRAGQVVVRTLACGICGSDLHAVHHLEHVARVAKRSGMHTELNPADDVIFGHEFCAELVDYGPRCARRFRPGTRVVSMPIAAGRSGMELIGFSNSLPGGFAEYMVLQESLLIEVSVELPAPLAAMTEPFAVGMHAVARSQMDRDSVALVVGCGPVGLAVLSALKIRGFGPVIACDFSEARRKAAAFLGADIVIDPTVTSPHEQWTKLDVPATLAEKAVFASLGRTGKRPVIFDCVGVKGLIQSLIEKAPPGSHIIVVGVCMQEDSIEPAIAINKELRLEFVFGYTAEEFACTLRHLSEQRIAAHAVLTGSVKLQEVAEAFGRLERERNLIKMVVTP